LRETGLDPAGGGSWDWSHDNAGATIRGMDVPDVRIPDHGFRVAR
jgi:hypothetical protein